MLLYSSMARLFGPYSMFEMRVLVLLVSLAMALLLYFMVRTESTPWCGLAAGLVFVHFNLFFEGLTTNREWFSIFFLLLGALFYWLWDRRAGRPRLVAHLLRRGAHGSGALVQAASRLPGASRAGLLAWRAVAGDEPAAQPGRPADLRRGRAWPPRRPTLEGSCWPAPSGTTSGELVTDWNVYTMGNATAFPSGDVGGPAALPGQPVLAAPLPAAAARRRGRERRRTEPHGAARGAAARFRPAAVREAAGTVVRTVLPGLPGHDLPGRALLRALLPVLRLPRGRPGRPGDPRPDRLARFGALAARPRRALAPAVGRGPRLRAAATTLPRASATCGPSPWSSCSTCWPGRGSCSSACSARGCACRWRRPA